MPRSRTYEKHIACLESPWDSKGDNGLNVKPILELSSKLRGIRYTHLPCRTATEFAANLKKISRKKSYSILYLSFHGSSGTLQLADKSEISLDELANELGDYFEDWIIHFGSCGTLKVKDEVLDNFIKNTGASLLIGYKANVYWVESAALDMLIFDYLQDYKNLKSLKKNIRASYKGLVKNTGLRFFPS